MFYSLHHKAFHFLHYIYLFLGAFALFDVIVMKFFFKEFILDCLLFMYTTTTDLYMFISYPTTLQKLLVAIFFCVESRGFYTD